MSMTSEPNTALAAGNGFDELNWVAVWCLMLEVSAAVENVRSVAVAFDGIVRLFRKIRCLWRLCFRRLDVFEWFRQAEI